MALTLSRERAKQLFPRASGQFLSLNCEAGAPGISDPESKRDQIQPLDGGAPGKKQSKERVIVRIVRFGCRLLDRDNLFGGAKPVVDCLKESGLIVNDTEDEIDLQVTQQQVFNSDQQRTELEIVWPDSNG